MERQDGARSHPERRGEALSPDFYHRLEMLSLSIYLIGEHADDPAQVREYSRSAEQHIDTLRRWLA
jgi:hypothetical protein